MSQELATETRSTPLGLRLTRYSETAAASFLALYAFFAGLQSSAQIIATTNRRLFVSVFCGVVFAVFWLYLHFRKPSWLGPGGITIKISHPKFTHWLMLSGIIFFTWAPAFPWFMPPSQLEQTTALEIQRQVGVLGEKMRIADLLYQQMRENENRAEQLSKLPRETLILLPPPRPYQGLAEALQADLPQFTVNVDQRAAELAGSGERFRVQAKIFKQFEYVQGEEGRVLTSFRMSWDRYARSGLRVTKISAYQRSYQYLILGVYLRTLREMQPDLKKIGISGSGIPDTLAALNDLSAADKKRLEQGIPPELKESDFVPSEIHY